MHPAERVRDLDDAAHRLRACRLCVAAGDGVVPPPISDVRVTHRALILGQAPGIHEPTLGRPFAARAGARLRAWFAPWGLDGEERFRAIFAMTAVAKCYPGRDPGQRGDRRPPPAVLARCAPWTDVLVRLLDPALLIPVGGMAITATLGPGRLDERVGRRFEADGRVVVPLPHPSGASAWTNAAAHRVLVTRATELIAAELGLERSG